MVGRVLSMKENRKIWLLSIVLLGINGIVGDRYFPIYQTKHIPIIGSASLGVPLFDAVIAGCIALCFAEGAYLCNGGTYLYTKTCIR